MAITRVQGNARGFITTGTSITVTQVSDPINGNVNVAIIACYGASGMKVSSIAQTGVTWTYQIKKTTTGMAVAIWFGVVGAGASKTITITLAVSAYNGAVGDVCEYSGVLTSSFLDKTAINTGTGTTSDTGTTANTTQADELWIGAILSDYRAQSNPTQGFTLLDGAQIPGECSGGYLEKIVSAIGTANSGDTLTSSSVWLGCIATFKAAAGATAKSFSDVGGGSDAFINPYRAMPFSETGHGAETFNTPFRSMGFADVGHGADVFTLLRALGFTDVGHGSDVFQILFKAMGFADTGHGSEAFTIPFKGLGFSDSGHGADSFSKFVTFLNQVFADTGHGVDAFIIPFKALGFTDVAGGIDSFLKDVWGPILKAFSDAGYGAEAFETIIAPALHKWGVALPFRLLQKYLATGRAVYLESLKKEITGKSIHPKRLNLEAHGTAVKAVRTDLTIEFRTVHKALNLQGYGKALRSVQSKGTLQGRKIEQVIMQLPVTGKQRLDLILELLGIELTLTYMFVAVVDDRTCEHCLQHDTKHFTREQIDMQFPDRDDTDYTLILPNAHPHCRCLLILL
jgi:hypothetical protein